MSAGKGDNPRPTDKSKFDPNFDEINWKSKKSKYRYYIALGALHRVNESCESEYWSTWDVMLQDHVPARWKPAVRHTMPLAGDFISEERAFEIMKQVEKDSKQQALKDDAVVIYKETRNGSV